MPATMNDIAREVGVSQATVSYVLSGRPDKSISEPVRASIFEAAERLGYRPNRLARAMVTAHTGTLGAAVRSLVGGWDAHLAEGIEEEAFEQEASLFLGCSHHDPGRERALLERFLEYRVDGVVIEPTVLPPSPGCYRAVLDAGVPMVFMILCPEGLRADFVEMDNFKAGYEAGRHLIETGRRRLAYVRPRLAHPDCEERYRGFAAAAREYGVAPPRVLAAGRQGLELAESIGYRAVRAHPESGESFDGLYAFGDYVALGAMQALKERGVRIGEDIGVVGGDDVPEASEADPPLSTVRQPMREIGAEAVRLLLRRTSGEQDLPPQRILLEPTLVVRASSAGL